MLNEQDRDDIVSRLSAILADRIEKLQADYSNLPQSDSELKMSLLGHIQEAISIKAKIDGGDWI